MNAKAQKIGHISLTNYVAYEEPESLRSRIGHYDLARKMVQPLSFISGTPIENLYQVIEVGESNIISQSEPLSVSVIKILPPLTGRDILCVGKNYAEHAKEFNSSGFDSSDKVDQPSHPVIFTKRFTSIIADGEDIYPHPNLTQTADYEGEIGVIIGKPGFRISEADAMDHIWGYTIINDVTARERQRDHKQFYIGKSPDTFCPMGPIAVPASRLEQVLRVQTFVNGELRQSATTDDLIFSIPHLIKTMSEGQTLMLGDVLATGTPAGVGIGRIPPVYLMPGDIVSISVTGLGTLTNGIADPTSLNPIVKQVQAMSHLQRNNTSKVPDPSILTKVNGKPLHYKRLGEMTKPPIVFVHGLGGSTELYTPLVQAMGLDASQSLHLFDLEGHGLSPTSPLSKLSIESFAEDLDGVFQHANITSGATLVAQSTGCLIAVRFALRHIGKVSKLVLIGPQPSPFTEAESQAMHARAHTARTRGMVAIADAVASTETSAKTKTSNPLAVAAVRMSLLGQNPEGYAKACTALAEAEGFDFGALRVKTLVVAGSEDSISLPQVCEKYVAAMEGKAILQMLEGVGHWSVFEDVQGVAKIIEEFLKAV